MQFTLLGTSTSVGIPVIGCDCKICVSNEPRHHRLRSSAHILTETHSLLIDSGPDLRQQSLNHGLTKLDAVFYTHQHLDHIAGFDELRAFCWHREDPLPLYSTPACLAELERMYGWAFSPSSAERGYVRAESRPIIAPLQIGETLITPLPVVHGNFETIGYRFDHNEKSIAYIPDVKKIPEATFSLLNGLNHLVIDCLRVTHHSTHMSLEESYAAAERIAAEQTWLTHVAHEMDVLAVESSLPKHIKFAYDTQIL